jgi:hypothetical protein
MVPSVTLLLTLVLAALGMAVRSIFPLGLRIPHCTLVVSSTSMVEVVPPLVVQSRWQVALELQRLAEPFQFQAAAARQRRVVTFFCNLQTVVWLVRAVP